MISMEMMSIESARSLRTNMLLKAIVEEKSQWTLRGLQILGVTGGDVTVWGCLVVDRIPRQMHVLGKDLEKVPLVGNN
jgi:hypothetical protein